MMTKEEAKAAIERGEKVTHRLFLPNEFITLSKNKDDLEDEEGYELNPYLFWLGRSDKMFSDGWEIWEEQK